MLFSSFQHTHPFNWHCNSIIDSGGRQTQRDVSRDIVEESAERRYGVVPYVLELHHQMSPQFLINDGHRDRTGLVLQEVPVVRGLQLDL